MHEKAMHDALTLRRDFTSICGTKSMRILQADVLHIHRTTLLYRLRRIQELTRLVPDDRDTILHLQLSYALMERRG